MKKFLSIILSAVIIISMLLSAVTVNAATPASFETDFSAYTGTSTFKAAYDSSGKQIDFTFSKTADGLRYFRKSDEVLYNPTGGDRTHLAGYRVFGVSKTGSNTSLFEVSANTCYMVELSYNCVTLGEGADITLKTAYNHHGGYADGTNDYINMKTEPNGTTDVVINSTGSKKITAYFTTSEIISNRNRLFMYIDTTLNKGFDLDITFTYLKITPLPSITVVDVNSGNETLYYGVAGTAFSLEYTPAQEIQLANSKGEYVRPAVDLFADSELKNAATSVTFPESGNAVYYIENENVTIENQVAFCGFDSYNLRNKLANTENQTAGFGTLATALANSGTITEEDAYTGSKSLKIVSNGSTADNDVCYYIGNGYEMTEGVTYRLTFRYRAANSNNAGGVTFMFNSANSFSDIPSVDNVSENSLKISADSLNANTVWKRVTLYYTADLNPRDNLSEYTAEDERLLLAPVLRVIPEDGKAASIYVDTCVISKVVESVGTSVLVDESAEQAGAQAIRFFFTYNLNDEKIVTDSASSPVAKRGIIYAASKDLSSPSLLNLENAAENDKIFALEKTDLSSCWSYNEEDGKTVFSFYLKDIPERNLNCRLSARAYVQLEDGTVFYSSVLNESANTVKEKVERKDMYYEFVDVGNEYKDFNIYIPTTETSGLYYTKFQFKYTKQAQAANIADAQKANTAYNQETYRIQGASLVKKAKDNVTFTEVYKLLQSGEIEFAVKESGTTDFIGGYHGDEIMNWSKLVIDGKEIDLKGEALGISTCNSIVFETDTVMYRCASGTAENTKGTAVANHYLKYVIDSKNGIVLTQNLEWLVGGLKLESPMVCMYTVNRYSNNKIVTDTIDYYKWDGSYIDTVDASIYGPNVEGGNKYSSYAGPAYACAYSKKSGITAYVGYENVEGLKDKFNNYVWIRPYGDNKVYYQANAGSTTVAGEKWEWIDYFYFDYAVPNN